MAKQLKYRQPIFNADKTFNDWHYWGIGIEQGGETANVGWLSFKLGITNPDDSQQATGLLDRNGNEIYEGDIILDCLTKAEMLVVNGRNKNNAYNGWYCQYLNVDTRDVAINGDYDTNRNSQIEIIGNITERAIKLLNEGGKI